VTQRGNRRAQKNGDYALCRDLLTEAAVKTEAEIWCYCLMSNHMYVIVAPAARIRFCAGRYTSFINARHRWTRRILPGRFGTVVMGEPHLAHAMRYGSLNPVRARVVARAEDWRWSSVGAHVAGIDDDLVTVASALQRWETSGRPIGSADGIAAIGKQAGRVLSRRSAVRSRNPRRIGAFSNLAPYLRGEHINIRIESRVNVRDWLRDAILEKHEGFYELAQRKHKITSAGKLQLEAKDDMKKRGVKSPNIGDTLALTLLWATEGQNLVGSRTRPLRLTLAHEPANCHSGVAIDGQ